MATTLFAKKLADIALQQYTTYKNMDEVEVKLCAQIKKYWTDLGFPFPGCTGDGTAWSAVFVSWCVKKAGATSEEFKFSPSHSKFVHKAIQNTTQNVGMFKGRKINEYKLKIGDILHNNRLGNIFDFEFAKNHDSYASHSAIVIEIGEDNKGKYALTIGGNEGDSIRVKEIRLDRDGYVKQRPANPYISIIENQK